MLVSEKVQHALEEKREAFRKAASDIADERTRYGELLDAMSTLGRQEIMDLVGGVPWPGARPTFEQNQHQLIVPFTPEWRNAQEARAWALARLNGVPTVAIDGSQIAPSKEFGVPISLIQVAWFENYHLSERAYIKDVRNEVLAPGDDPLESDQYAFVESRVSQRRFALEMEVAAERLRGLDPDAGPVVLVDGTFVLSFAGRMAPKGREAYLAALFQLLDASTECRVPAVGFVDLSYSADVIRMLETIFDRPQGRLFDAQLLASRMKPFDRTIAFQCARGDVLPYYQTADRSYSDDLYFVYLKTGLEQMPARIDFPRWVLEAGLLDHIVDIVRAEAVVGGGYPYALETADAAAVLSMEDRLRFYRLFHDFAQSAGVTSGLPAKSLSKSHRR